MKLYYDSNTIGISKILSCSILWILYRKLFRFMGLKYILYMPKYCNPLNWKLNVWVGKASPTYYRELLFYKSKGYTNLVFHWQYLCIKPHKQIHNLVRTSGCYDKLRSLYESHFYYTQIRNHFYMSFIFKSRSNLHFDIIWYIPTFDINIIIWSTSGHH